MIRWLIAVSMMTMLISDPALQFEVGIDCCFGATATSRPEKGSDAAATHLRPVPSEEQRDVERPAARPSPAPGPGASAS